MGTFRPNSEASARDNLDSSNTAPGFLISPPTRFANEYANLKVAALAPSVNIAMHSMPSAASDPLIADEDEVPRDDESEADESGLATSEVVDESIIVAPSPFIWGLTFCAGVSGLLFGYDTGVISSTLVSIGSDLSGRPLTTLDKSLITSCTSFFALVMSPLTGILADALGRRKVIWGADLLFIIGALWQAWTPSVWGMIFGRSIVGAAVGSASFVVPLYISELAPSPFRGRMVVVSALFITGGQVVAYIIGWLFSEMVHGWRWMVGLGALPAAVQFCMLWFMPETPRWLVKSGKKHTAKRVLDRVYGASNGPDERRLVRLVLRRIEKEILHEHDLATARIGKAGWSAKLDKVYDDLTQLFVVGGNRRALVIACLLQGAQQLCGFVSARNLSHLYISSWPS